MPPPRNVYKTTPAAHELLSHLGHALLLLVRYYAAPVTGKASACSQNGRSPSETIFRGQYLATEIGSHKAFQEIRRSDDQ